MRFANNPLLAPRHWIHIAEAGMALAAAAVATRVLPFRRYIRLGAGSLPPRAQASGPELARIVAAVGRRVPFRAVCLQQGMALQWMLRRRGVDAVLHYGIRLGVTEREELAAHVWVSVGGAVVLGAPQHEAYQEVARFPESLPELA